MKRRFSAGYTIIEVLIVLAVTGGLLSSVMLTLGGKQAQTEAVESVRSLDSNLASLSREVASGYYTSGYWCKAPPAGTVTLETGGTSGSNTGCIFIGKIMNFTDTNGLIINLLGRQFADNKPNTDVSSLAEAQPIKVTDAVTGSTDDTSIYSYSYNLQVSGIYDSTASTQYMALAFMVELGGGISNTNPVTGSRGIQLYGVKGSVIGNPTGKNILVTAADLVALPEGAIICMKTGNGKAAELTVGMGGNQYSTNTLIANGVDDVCKLP